MLMLVWFNLIGITYWIMGRRGRRILPRCLEGRLEVLGFITKVIGVTRMQSLVTADRMSVILKGGWWVLHAG